MKGLFTLLFLLSTIFLSGCSTDLTIVDPWARPAAVGQNSALYFEIRNQSDRDEALLRVEGDLARAFEIHMTMALEIESDEMDGMIDAANGGLEIDDVMQMMPQDRLEIPAGESAIFQPGSLHVMMIDLNQALIEGDQITLTFVFESGLNLEIDAEVISP